MRSLPIAAVLCVCLLAVPMAAAPAQGAGGWGVLVTPENVSTGGTATVLVSGPADSFCTVRVLNPQGGTAWEAFLIIGEAGMGSVNFTVPIDAGSGEYSVSVISTEGVELAHRAVLVEFDESNYMMAKLLEYDEKIAAQVVANARLAKENQELQERSERVMWFAFMAMAAGAFAWTLTVWKGKDLLRALIARQAREKGLRARMCTALNFFTDPGVEGESGLDMFQPSLAASRAELRAKVKGSKTAVKRGPRIYLQTERDPQIYAAYDLIPVPDPRDPIRRQMTEAVKEPEKVTMKEKGKRMASKAGKAVKSKVKRKPKSEDKSAEGARS